MAKLGKNANVISNWHHPIENFQTSTMEFYAAVEQALVAKEIPDYTVSRIDWREGGVLTARRSTCGSDEGSRFRPLRSAVRHRLLLLVVVCRTPDCARAFVGDPDVFPRVCGHWNMYRFARFIPGLFWILLSVWGGIWSLGYLLREGKIGTEAEDVVLVYSVLRRSLRTLFPATTYYRTDTTLMYQSVVHTAVLDAVEQLLSQRVSVPSLELERKPIMREFYRR